MGILFPVLRAKSSKNDVLLNRHFSIKAYELASYIHSISSAAQKGRFYDHLPVFNVIALPAMFPQCTQKAFLKEQFNAPD